MPSIKCQQCNLVNFSTQTHCKRCGSALNNYAPLADQRTYQTTIEQNNQTQPLPPANFDQNYQSQQYQTSFDQNYQNQSGQTTFDQGYPQTYPPNYGQSNHTQPLYQPAPPYQNQYQQPAVFQGYQPLPPQNAAQPVFYANLYQPQVVYSTCIKCGDHHNVSIRKIKKDYVPPAVYITFLAGILIGAILVSILRVRHEINATFCPRCWNNFASVSWVESLSVIGFAGLLIVAGIAGVASSSWIIFFFGLIIASLVAYVGINYKKKHSPVFKRITRHEVTIADPVNGDIIFNT